MSVEEGQICPKCKDGTLQYQPSPDCYCHMVAPCSYCEDMPLTCDNCGAEFYHEEH
jgi:hypothetical protein